MKIWTLAIGAACALLSFQCNSPAQGILGVNPVAPDDTTPSAGATDPNAPIFEQKLKITAPSDIASLAFSPNSAYLAAGCSGDLLIWDASGAVQYDLKAKAGQLMPRGAHPSKGEGPAKGERAGRKRGGEASPPTVTALLWSPDGSKIAGMIGDAGVGVWDANAGKFLFGLVEPKNTITSLAWSMDGTTIATGSAKGTVRLWSAATGAFLRDLATCGVMVEKLGFNVSGKTLTGLGPPSANSDATAATVTICRWNLATGAVANKKDITICGDLEPKSPDLAIDGEYFVNANDFNAPAPYEVWSTKTMDADFGVGAPTRESIFENSIHMSPYADEFLACGWGIKLYSVFDKSIIASIHDASGTYTYQKLIAAPATSAKNHEVAVAWDDTIYLYGP